MRRRGRHGEALGGVRSDVGGLHVVEEGDDNRCRQREADDAAGREPGETRAPARRLQAEETGDGPARAEEPVQVGHFGEAGVDRQGDAQGQDDPTRPPSPRGRVDDILDAEQHHGHEGNGVDDRVGDPREGPVHGEEGSADGGEDGAGAQSP